MLLLWLSPWDDNTLSLPLTGAATAELREECLDEVPPPLDKSQCLQLQQLLTDSRLCGHPTMSVKVVAILTARF